MLLSSWPCMTHAYNNFLCFTISSLNWFAVWITSRSKSCLELQYKPDIQFLCHLGVLRMGKYFLVHWNWLYLLITLSSTELVSLHTQPSSKKFSSLSFPYRCLTYLPYFHCSPLLPLWKHSGNWGKMVSGLHLLRPAADWLQDTRVVQIYFCPQAQLIMSLIIIII